MNPSASGAASPTGRPAVHAAILFRATRCERPPDLIFTIRPDPAGEPAPGAALGRCSHLFFERHRLVIHGTTLVVTDSAALEEKARNKGYRPFGFLGRHTGVSIHRCDRCRRKKTLAQTIICPCCAHSVAPMQGATLVSTDMARSRLVNPEFEEYTTTALDGAMTVVCRACGAKYFGEDKSNSTWAGNAILTPIGYDELRAMLTKVA